MHGKFCFFDDELLMMWQLEANLLNLLYENLARFDEKIESDRAGVYHVLGQERPISLLVTD